MIAILQGVEQPAWPDAAELTMDEPATLTASATGASRLWLLNENMPDIAGDQADEAAIRAQPVCIASSEWSFGNLGPTVLFVHQRRGEELHVGYFVYWSVERPWGQNALTYTVLPALAIDAAYSHFLFFLPGLQRVLYGSGDIEGATVVYDASQASGLIPLRGTAEDAVHHEIALSQSDLLTPNGRVVLLTSVWSHQLGTRGAAAYVARPDVPTRCFEADSILPMTREVARRFRLGSPDRPLRARAAWRATARKT